MAPERTELTWKYKPADLFEEAYESSRADAKLRLADGSALITVPGSAPNETLETDLRKWIDFLLNARGLQTTRAYELEADPAVIEIEDGRRNLYLRAKIGVIMVVGSPVDLVQTNADGQVIRDTGAERRAAQKSELDDLLAKAQKSPILAFLLERFNAALREPAVEFVRLYEIRDALSAAFGSDRNAKQQVKITNADWSEFGRLANDAPILEGRHNGKHAAALRHATDAERTVMRSLAEKMIRNFAETI